MKRILALCLVLVLSISLCACQNTANTESNNSNTNSSEEYETTLIRRLTGTENIDNISDFAIGDTYGNESFIITDKKDLNFLKQYTYSGELPKNETNEIFKYPDTKIVVLKSNNGELSFFILSDCRIAIQVMCGDSAVPESERTYEIYTADKENMLTEKKLNKLLEKYNGNNVGVGVHDNLQN